jgi:hypothetical protein
MMVAPETNQGALIAGCLQGEEDELPCQEMAERCFVSPSIVRRFVLAVPQPQKESQWEKIRKGDGMPYAFINETKQ